VCFASKKSSEQEIFVPSGMDLAVKPFTTLVNRASMEPSVGLSPKEAVFYHTSNILLLGH
jgi:hypothetical protein